MVLWGEGGGQKISDIKRVRNWRLRCCWVCSRSDEAGMDLL